MKANVLRMVGLLLGVIVLVTPLASAQEDVVAVEPAETPKSETRETRVLVEYDYSLARAVGTDLRIGSLLDSGGTRVRSLYLPVETDVAQGFRFGWMLPGGFGELVAAYRSFSASSSSVVSRPGDFVFGITEAYPFAHGVADDGLADAINASAVFSSHDVHVDWRFPVVERPRFRMRLSVGLRTFDYKQDEAIAYYALNPGLPPLIDPGGADRSYLNPLPDRVGSVSEYAGRGVQAGADAVVPIIGDRLQFEAAATFGVLRGTARSRYASVTSYYIFDDGIDQTPISFEEFLAFANQGVTGNLDQLTISVALDNPGRSTMNPVMDLSLGLRSRVWRGLELAAGGRMSFVQDAVHELRPKTFTAGPVGQPAFDGFDEQWRDASFETFYATLGYRF